jgi:hypothetical protein
MAGGESSVRRPLFGGAISTAIPVRFQVHAPFFQPPAHTPLPLLMPFLICQDVSNIREVPDHQEVLVDPARDESLIVELLDLKPEVDDAGSALWFLRDVADEQDAGDNLVMSCQQHLLDFQLSE